MTRLAQTERTALCDTALQVGEDRRTLCGEWTVKDLVVHLLVREGSPAAVGIVVAPLSGLTDRVSRRLGRRDFTVLVEKLRNGPPMLSPYAVSKVDDLLNTMEFFVHHEDIRRAQPDWSPRLLGDEVEQTLWSALAAPARMLTRKVPTGVAVEDSRDGSRAVVHKGSPTAVVRGLPSEVALYLFGRSEQARVELSGDQGAVDALRATSLGL